MYFMVPNGSVIICPAGAELLDDVARQGAFVRVPAGEHLLIAEHLIGQVFVE